MNIIARQLDTLKPDYAAVAFDIKHPTFRHEMYPEYKAGRHATPPELLEQFPDAKECLALMGLKVMELEGYEADDIQGTVANFAHSYEDTEAYVLSGDRDLLPLIDDKITVLLVGTGDTKAMHREEFTEKYGIAPELFVDMKALMGDSSDNIPGVKGIGEKTAATLLQNFGSLEGIYENLEDKRIAKGVRAKLEADRENAFMSRELSRIITDAPVGVSLEDLAYTGMDCEGLYRKFAELELHSFVTKFKLLEKIKCKSDASTPDNSKLLFTDSKIGNGCSSADKADTGTGLCENSEVGTADTASSVTVTEESFTEASAEDICQLKDSRLGFCLTDGAVYFSSGDSNLVYSGELSLIKDFFSRERELICFRGKKILHALNAAGVTVADSIRLLDLELYSYVLHPGVATSLSAELSEHLGLTVADDTPCPSAMLRLEGAMRERIKADGLEYILDEIELPLLPILFETELNGFKINKGGMLEFSDALEELARDLQERIYFQAGESFNINSPKQLGEVLFVKLGLPYKKKKNKNGFSTDAETLEELRPHSPIIDDILEYRQVMKLRGTYAAALPLVADGEDRIHTDFKQALTATGRLSSAEPNLQNIPIRTKMGREMRRYFIADEGYTLVDADYSQIELRLLAHISGDYTMTEAFREGIDIHRKTASAVFGVPEESVNEEMRKRAKAVNFGIVYGISGFSLAKDIGTTVSEASKYIKSYLMMYPAIDCYLEEVVKTATEKGYTETIFGRRRYIHELSSSNRVLQAFGKRVAMNAPIQGTAADIMKLAMIKVYKRLKAQVPEARLVMQVHDELVVEAPDGLVEKVKAILAEEMNSTAELTVPLTVDVTSGKNWLEQE